MRSVVSVAGAFSVVNGKSGMYGVGGALAYVARYVVVLYSIWRGVGSKNQAVKNGAAEK